MPRIGRLMVRAAVALWWCVSALLAGGTAPAPPGDLDPSFSGDGRVSLPAAGSFVTRALALAPDGSIVIAGASCAPDPATADATCLREGDASFRLARLTRDGGLDSEFGDGGFVTTPVGAGRSQAFDVVVLPSGGIVAAGVARDADGRDALALVRYDERG